MSGNQRFQYKLWNLVNSNKSNCIQWNKTGDAILFNFMQFKKEILDIDADFCKSNKLASFIRQLNLYGFKKIADTKRMRKRDSHEFWNTFFLRGREDLLRYVKRNSISPRTKKRGSAGRKSVRTHHIQDHKKEPYNRRRGRPKKANQVKTNTKENNPNHKMKNLQCGLAETSTKRLCSYYSERKEDSESILQDDKFINGKDVQCWKNRYNLKNSNITPSESKIEELEQVKNSFDCGSESKYCIAQDSTKTKISDPIKNISKTKEGNISVFSDITNVASRVTDIPKPVNQHKIPNMSQLWHSEKRSQSLLINNSLNQICSSDIRPKIHKWEMQALVDENQHVLLKISEPQKSCKSEISDNPSLKICYLQWKPQKKKINTEKNFPGEKMSQDATKKCSCSSLMKTEELDSYKSKYLYETDCEITDEYLELREAYFRHYSERRPKTCSCFTPCKI